MKCSFVLLAGLLTISCASKSSINANSANRSALYDPPTVTMRPGVVYGFVEGEITGANQKWHSDYSYRRAVIIGSK